MAIDEVKYLRGRVAFTVSPPVSGCPTGLDGVWHIGHAQTLYLGYTHCLEKGIPFEVRLDGVRAAADLDRSGAIVDLCNLMGFLGIHPQRLYWQPQERPDRAKVEQALGERTELFLSVFTLPHLELPAYAGLICDDVLDNHPSLIIRGQEFCSPTRWCADKVNAAAMECHLLGENIAYLSAGRQKHEYNTPLVTAGGYKLSKSSGSVPHWSVLTMGTPQQAQGFLVKHSKETWEWSWQVWKDWLEGTKCNQLQKGQSA